MSNADGPSRVRPRRGGANAGRGRGGRAPAERRCAHRDVPARGPWSASRYDGGATNGARRRARRARGRAPGERGESRAELSRRALKGPKAEPTAAQRAAARARILDAMAADLAEETAAPRPEGRTLHSPAHDSTTVTARANAGWGEIRGRVTESLLKLFAPAGEVFAMRAVRMAAVPLLALLVVGSIWTGMVADRGESDSPGAGNTRSGSTPTTRGLVTPAENDLKRDIATAEAARGPAHP